MTICGQGLSSDIPQAGFFNEFFKYLKSIGHDMGISPIRAVNLLNKVIDHKNISRSASYPFYISNTKLADAKTTCS